MEEGAARAAGMNVYLVKPVSPATSPRPWPRFSKISRLSIFCSAAATYLADTAQSPWIHDVAGRHGLSVVYVRELFAAEDATFSDFFVLQWRLAIAHMMLSDTRIADRSVGTIAFKVGFGSVTTFNRVFKKRCGVKPDQVNEW